MKKDRPQRCRDFFGKTYAYSWLSSRGSWPQYLAEFKQRVFAARPDGQRLERLDQVSGNTFYSQCDRLLYKELN